MIVNGFQFPASFVLKTVQALGYSLYRDGDAYDCVLDAQAQVEDKTNAPLPFTSHGGLLTSQWLSAVWNKDDWDCEVRSSMESKASVHRIFRTQKLFLIR